MNLSEIAARLEAISVEVEALSDVALEAGDNSEETLAQIEALDNEFTGLKAKQDRQEKIQARIDEIVASRVAPSAPAVEPEASIEPELQKENVMDKIPAAAKYNKSNVFASSEDAYVAGQFLLATAGDRQAADFMAAQSEGDNAKGGFTVPTPLSSELINLVEQYGVARNVCRRIVMGSETWSVPKVVGHTTIYYPAEAEALTASDMNFSQVSLTAKKMAGLVKMSTEISEDSIISMTDTIVRDLAWGFSKAEDENLFTGGPIYTGGITGETANVNSATSVVDVPSITLEDLVAVTAGVGQERGLNNKWYMSPTLWNGQVRDLLNAAGGNADTNLAAGVSRSLFGYPVELVNAMSGAAAASGDLLCVFGDLGVSHYFGDRRNLNFQYLDQLFAVNDQVGIKCTQRIDIAGVNPEVLSLLSVA